ncbi:MAG: sulfotransferase [Bacteroidetes bacterium]|nr:sulfotransferase [Bacteroidota bacterium]
MKNKATVRPGDFNKQPLWFKALNDVWRGTYFLGTQIRLEKDDIIKSARKLTGLYDLGSDFLDEPLDRMLWSINHEAQLHPVGRFISKQRLVNLLAVKLRAEYWFKKHPEILDQPLYPVWLITGLQRTGTTKLQRLLAADPDNRVLASWEAINPVPLNDDFRLKEKRIKKAWMSEKALRLMAPGFFAIHPVEHLAPEEDILLLDVTFLSTTPEATMHVPSYASWLESIYQAPAYEYGMKLLKFLQWQKPAKRWVLKSPHHLEFLPLVHKYFQDVRILWTHRDVHRSIPSFLSMMAHSRMIFSNNVSLQGVAAHWVRKSGYMLNKGLDFRTSDHKEGLFTDILYNDFLEDSLKSLTKIYGDNGGINEGLSERFRHAELINPPGKYGLHEYDIRDFDLSPDDIDKHTADYQHFIKDVSYGKQEKL